MVIVRSMAYIISFPDVDEDRSCFRGRCSEFAVHFLSTEFTKWRTQTHVSSTPAILELKGLSIAQKWGGGVLYIPFARYHMWIQIILGTYVVLSLSLIIDMQRSLMWWMREGRTLERDRKDTIKLFL